MQGRASSHRSLSSVDKGVVTVEKSTSVYIDENQDASVLKTVFVTPDRIRHTPAEMSWVARDFRFHTGEVLPELRLHYTTVGDASRPPVLILHGTTGSGSGIRKAMMALTGWRWMAPIASPMPRLGLAARSTPMSS
jgi:hypothetical protein